VQRPSAAARRLGTAIVPPRCTFGPLHGAFRRRWGAPTGRTLGRLPAAARLDFRAARRGEVDLARTRLMFSSRSGRTTNDSGRRPTRVLHVRSPDRAKPQVDLLLAACEPSHAALPLRRISEVATVIDRSRPPRRFAATTILAVCWWPERFPIDAPRPSAPRGRDIAERISIDFQRRESAARALRFSESWALNVPPASGFFHAPNR